MKPLNVAIVGATGLVGLEFISILEERNFPIDKLFPFASDNSLGLTVTYKNREIDVIPLNEKEIEKHPVDLALFSAGAGVALDFARHFAERGAIVVDNSSAFRMDDDVRDDLVKSFFHSVERIGRLYHRGLFSVVGRKVGQKLSDCSDALFFRSVREVCYTRFCHVDCRAAKIFNRNIFVCNGLYDFRAGKEHV